MAQKRGSWRTLRAVRDEGRMLLGLKEDSFDITIVARDSYERASIWESRSVDNYIA